MRMEFLGDSYDVVKRFLLATAAPGARWVAFPMFTHPVSAEQLAAFETLLNVRVAPAVALTPHTDRAAYLAAQPEQQHIFIDPDVGVRLTPTGPAASVRYVFGAELVDLCLREPLRLVAAFDQSLPRGRKREAMVKKLGFFANRGVCGFAYLSHACFVFLSASAQVCHDAHAKLVASGLPVERLLTSAIPGLIESRAARA